MIFCRALDVTDCQEKNQIDNPFIYEKKNDLFDWEKLQ